MLASEPPASPGAPQSHDSRPPSRRSSRLASPSSSLGTGSNISDANQMSQSFKLYETRRGSLEELSLARRENISVIPSLKNAVNDLDDDEFIVLQVVSGPFKMKDGSLAFDCLIADKHNPQAYRARKRTWNKSTGSCEIPKKMWEDFLKFRMVLSDPNTKILNVSMHTFCVHTFCMHTLCIR